MNIQEQEKNIFLDNTRKLPQKELILTIKELITTEFQKYLDINGVDYITEFYSIERKRQILKEIQEQLKENDSKEIQELFNVNYYKILKEQEKIYKLNEIYLQNKKEQEEETTENVRTNKTKFVAMVILKTMTFIILSIFGFFAWVLYCYLTSGKAKRRRGRR